MMSYSRLWHHSRTKTSLEQILGDAGSERLVVCGATANHGADQMKYFTPSRLHDEFSKVFPTSEPLAI
jgi:hypothetical protein